MYVSIYLSSIVWYLSMKHRNGRFGGKRKIPNPTQPMPNAKPQTTLTSLTCSPSTNESKITTMADLETAANLGCTKCSEQLETGVRNHKSHDACCPRSQKYRLSGGGSPSLGNSDDLKHASPATDADPEQSDLTDAAAAAAAAASVWSKRKQAQDHDNQNNDNEDEDVNIVDVAGTLANNKNNNEDDDEYSDSRKLQPNPSIPRRIGNSIDFPLTNLRPHLICSLCKGYFRDPYTVADCLHTFCRSCLILFFRQGMRCCPTW